MVSDTLMQLYDALPPLYAENTHYFWNGKRLELRQRIESKTFSNDLSSFLTWPEIVTTMFVGEGEAVEREYEVVRTWYAYPQAIHEDSVGAPQLLSAHPFTSGNLVHQAYHLMQWERVMGKRISEVESIIEIGGGYGALAKVVRRAGFRGRYAIYDLPELSLLQYHYLRACEVEDIELIYVPPERDSCELLIALWSLSEMQQREQSKYLGAVSASHYLLAMNDVDWQGWDSRAPLLTLPCTRHATQMDGNYYLIG